SRPGPGALPDQSLLPREPNGRQSCRCEQGAWPTPSNLASDETFVEQFQGGRGERVHVCHAIARSSSQGPDALRGSRDRYACMAGGVAVPVCGGAGSTRFPNPPIGAKPVARDLCPDQRMGFGG